MRPYKELLTFSSLGHTLKIYDINMNLNPDPNPDMNPNMNMNSDETFMTDNCREFVHYFCEGRKRLPPILTYP